MSQQQIDLTNYRDRFGAKLPEGDYVLTLEELEQGETSKEPKRPMWTIYYRVVGGEYDGATVIDRITISDKTMFLVVGFLGAMGVKTPRKRLSVDPQRFVGRKVGAVIGDGNPFNGQVRSEVKSYYRLAQPASAEVSDLEDSFDGPEEVPAQDVAPAAAPAPAAVDTVDDADIDLDDLDV